MLRCASGRGAPGGQDIRFLPRAARMSVTMSDVARRAGVSLATVSRVINGNYPVATSTRDRVLTAIWDLGYVVNAHARALVTTSTGTVGVILHDPSDPYFGEIIRGV